MSFLKNVGISILDFICLVFTVGCAYLGIYSWRETWTIMHGDTLVVMGGFITLTTGAALFAFALGGIAGIVYLEKEVRR
jgi:hypothetical protein